MTDKPIAADSVLLIESPSMEVPSNEVPSKEAPSTTRCREDIGSKRRGDLSTGFYNSALNIAVLIAGLGYFVETFDFFLYNSMRVVSLTELGLSGDLLTKTGILILNCQIFGALIGGFVWGIWGDKIGRKKALLASILIYSMGMVINGFVQDPLSYGIARFITGFGVAGEVGLGATLIAETVCSANRTYALMFFTVMGVLGVTAAGASIEFVSWRTSCFAGGVIGLMLLTARSMLLESRLFTEITRKNVSRGSLRALLGRAQNLKKYLICVPILGTNFFVTGLLLTLGPEIAKAAGIHEPVKANIALGIYFFAAVAGDCLGAWLSNRLKSRKLVVWLFIVANACLAALFLQRLGLTAYEFYALCAVFGFCNLWAITGTVLVELFPTEMRATATTSNINCSRASVILMNGLFLFLKPNMGISSGLLIVATVVFALGFFCTWLLPETYNRPLTDDSD